MIKLDIIGKTFGKLTVIGYAGVVGVGKSKRSKYSAKCVCGNIKSYFRNVLVSQKTLSCGCHKIALCKQNAISQRKSRAQRQYTSYKNRAKYKNLVFQLTEEQFVYLVAMPCEYCSANKRNGLDRTDSNKGYILDNVVSCCTICNYMKKDLSKEQFLSQIKNISRKLNEQT